LAAAAGNSPASASGISVRIATPGASTVDVQLAERGGQIHVAVRTPDAGLEASLRQDLNTLVDSLEHAGFRTEALTPAGAAVAAEMSTATGSNLGASSQGGSQHNESGQNPPGQNSRGPFQQGSGADPQQQRQSQQQRDASKFWPVAAQLQSPTVTAIQENQTL
jgi:hypothetical protein